MIETDFTRLIGCEVPIQQAPMGKGATTPGLASAVANAGGLGMLSLSGYAVDVIENVIRETYKLTSKKIGANFLLYQPLDIESLEATAELVDVVDFFWGEPDKRLIEIAKRAGAIAGWQVGSKEEACLAEDAGCDFIIAQSIEAGGHVRGKVGLLPFLDQVIGSVNIPVLASGGIGSGAAVATVLAAGASGVRCGTRFLAAFESAAHPEYVQALIDAEASDTVYTDKFSVGWPGAPHRVLRRSLIAATEFEGKYVGTSFDSNIGTTREIPRFGVVDIHNGVSGNIAAMPQWAGESVGAVTKRQAASEIVDEMIRDARKILDRFRT